ncbi:hypothetical protein PYW07_000342 [Mythimna separata]|uniref:PiggyBac transposable element-derived protein domain-containing protein n=1 Tax=Mythimna separata TaxID=271217 RepID=A0AAD7Z2R0_MYTSE|nr:hypothetical protein PYW07_000342 [Mythimna separata]
MVWRDAHLVSMISTYHHLQEGIQNKYNRLTYKPKIVLDYNMSMGGVDRKDQFLSAQPVERLRNKVWYKKIFCRLLNTAIFNAYVIFSSQNPNIPPVPSPNNTPVPSSYKKTVFLKPHSPPKSIQGYNKEAHNAIIKDWNIPQPSNGCVISKNHNNDFKDTNFSVNDFLSALHNLLSQFNFSPSNAAPSCNTSQSIHNGQHQNNPVELPQSH